MLRAFVGAVFWNHRIRREADEVDAFALSEHLLDFRVLFRLRQFGGKLCFGVGDFVLLQHFANLRHACRCLRVGGGNGVDEFCPRQRFQYVDVPLAADEHGSGKEVRLDAVEIKGNHAAHGLAGGVNAVGVNRFFGNQVFDEAQGYADFVRGLPLVVDRRFGVGRHEDEGRVFRLRFVGCPNNAAVALHQRGFHAFVGGAGVGNEHHQRVFAAGFEVFRRVQVVLHFFARCWRRASRRLS